MRNLSLALAATISLAAPAIAGGPWISVELPANPYLGRGAFAVVRTYHHRTPAPYPVTGTAEGLVNGQRRSVPLTFALDEAPNGYIVANTWGEQGVWVLNMSVTGDHLGAGAVVGIDRNGEPAFTRFPRTAIGASRAATPREVEAMLRALEANAPPPALGRTGWSAIVFRTAMPLIVLVALVLGVARVGAGIIGRARRRRAETVTA